MASATPVLMNGLILGAFSFLLFSIFVDTTLLGTTDKVKKLLVRT